jgi:hypothetical protein
MPIYDFYTKLTDAVISSDAVLRIHRVMSACGYSQVERSVLLPGKAPSVPTAADRKLSVFTGCWTQPLNCRKERTDSVCSIPPLHSPDEAGEQPVKCYTSCSPINWSMRHSAECFVVHCLKNEYKCHIHFEHLLIYGLLNDAVNSSDYTALNARTICE